MSRRLHLVENTRTCERCYKDIGNYVFISGSFQCQDCASGKTAEDRREQEFWDNLDRKAPPDDAA